MYKQNHLQIGNRLFFAVFQADCCVLLYVKCFAFLFGCVSKRFFFSRLFDNVQLNGNQKARM